MIAVVIFTLIASIATFVTIQLSRSYQYGISKSKLDTSARNVNYLFNQAVQYSNSTALMGSAVQPTDTSFGTLNTWKVWCAGTTRFSAHISSGTNQYPNGLYRDTVGSGATSCTGTPLSSSKVQLIPSDASISLFEVSVSNNGTVFRLQTAFEMGQLSDFVGSNVTTSISLTPDANGNKLPKLPVCQTQAFGSFSYCAIVYYDNSVTSFIN